MKYIFFFTLSLMFSGIMFGQQNQTARIEKTSKLTDFKKSGEFHFTIPEQIKAEEIKRNATFYSENFAIKFNAKQHEITLILTANTEQNRRVIRRFFVSLHIQTIEIEGTSLTLEEFYNMHLK